MPTINEALLKLKKSISKINDDATKPARSPTTPPPKATMASALVSLFSARKLTTVCNESFLSGEFLLKS